MLNRYVKEIQGRKGLPKTDNILHIMSLNCFCKIHFQE